MDGVVGSDISSQHSVQGGLYSGCLPISVIHQTTKTSLQKCDAKRNRDRAATDTYGRPALDLIMAAEYVVQGTEALAAFSTDSRYTNRRQMAKNVSDKYWGEDSDRRPEHTRLSNWAVASSIARPPWPLINIMHIVHAGSYRGSRQSGRPFDSRR
ncbi:hypothetical protein MMC22_006480 [Lobaria immixta]|nr:hypothetical protein [Lobaria immixta]